MGQVEGEKYYVFFLTWMVPQKIAGSRIHNLEE
jgi:hypothetical protein